MKKLITLFISSLIIAGCSTATAPAPNNNETIDNNGTKEGSGDITVKIEETAVPAYKIFLVAPENKGADGKLIGCDDSIIAVDGTQTPTELTAESDTRDRMEAAYKELLANKDFEYSESGLQNTLYNSDITLESVMVDKSEAVIKLHGELNIGGTCDTPRAESQLVETALQFPEINSVEISLNGEALQDILSAKGE